MTSPGPSPALEFRDLCFSFAGRPALRHLDLRCPAGTVTGLVGPNGAGKSTALAVAAGLLVPGSGRVDFGGAAVTPGSAVSSPAGTGYLPQRSAFPPMLRVGEVLRLALAARGSGATVGERVLQVTGLEPWLDRPVGELSGGWVRRLGLASALVTPAALLLLDEPFVGLDPDTVDRLLEHLRARAAGGGTVLVASHDFEVMDQLQPRVAVLDEGVLRGPVETAASSRAFYRERLARPDVSVALEAHSRAAPTAHSSTDLDVEKPDEVPSAEEPAEKTRRGRHPALLIARREAALLYRGRAGRVAFGLLGAVAWLPVLLVPLRAGAVGIGGFHDTTLLTLALGGVVLPLLSLVAGADLLAGEIEDGSLATVLTLPISRAACFTGKAMARVGLLGSVYLISFAGAGLAMAAMRGADGWRDYAAVAAFGLLLCLASGGIGTVLGAAGRGRLRAFGAALFTWLLLVVALDALLLALVVVQAPAGPQEVGVHGHDELQVRTRSEPHASEHAHGDHRSEPALTAAVSPLTWLMLVNPVDLYRLSALATAPSLRARLALALPGGGPLSRFWPLAAGWLAWLAVPPLLALWRFRRAGLT